MPEKVPLAELDSRARKYVSNEWQIPLSKIKNWELVSARYRDDYDAIFFSYKYKMAAPLVIVVFDKNGMPERIMGYK